MNSIGPPIAQGLSEEQMPRQNLTAARERSLDSAYDDHSTKALNNLITN